MSTVITNPGQKQYKSQLEAIFADYDIFGGTDILGSLKKNLNEDAIKNSLRVWFSSKFGERYRNPNSGGIFFQQAGKGMGEERLARLQVRCLRDLDENFNGIFVTQEVIITPNNEKKYLEISITVFCSLLKKEISDTIKIRSPK